MKNKWLMVRFVILNFLGLLKLKHVKNNQNIELLFKINPYFIKETSLFILTNVLLDDNNIKKMTEYYIFINNFWQGSFWFKHNRNQKFYNNFKNILNELKNRNSEHPTHFWVVF